MSSPHVRAETGDDIEAIASITRAAFADHPHSRQTEQFIVAALRQAGALTLSLVAEQDGVVVGHIAFSPLTISDGSSGWYGLGPLSVTPARQRQGIGRRLVTRGLELLRQQGAHGCVLVGEPEYYRHFGFTQLPQLQLADVPAQYLLALPFGVQQAGGEIAFHPAFGAQS